MDLTCDMIDACLTAKSEFDAQHTEYVTSGRLLTYYVCLIHDVSDFAKLRFVVRVEHHGASKKSYYVLYDPATRLFRITEEELLKFRVRFEERGGDK